MKLAHLSLTARNADRLAAFYQSALGFTERRPPKRLSGETVWRGNGLPGVEIYAIWLNISGPEAPFLEIMQYAPMAERPAPEVNAPGFGHMALAVPDLAATVERVLRCGGSLQGEITDFGTQARPHLIVYLRDPEGNILELEQPPGP